MIGGLWGVGRKVWLFRYGNGFGNVAFQISIDKIKKIVVWACRNIKWNGKGSGE